MQLAFSKGLQINTIQLIVNSIMLVSFYHGVFLKKNRNYATQHFIVLLFSF